MSEQLALSEEIQHPAVVDELNRSLAYDSNLLLGLLALLEDRRPGTEELHLDPPRKLVERGAVEAAERLVLHQELSDVVHGLDYPPLHQR